MTWSDFCKVKKVCNCRKQPGKSLMNGSTEPWIITGRNSTISVLHLLSHTCKQAGLTAVSVSAQFAVLADSFFCQPLCTLRKAAVSVLPQSSPFLMKDESSLLLKMKVLSPACYRQKHLFWQPPYAAIRQKRNLSAKGLNCSQFIIFTTGTISSPKYNAPLGWRIISLTNLHSHSSFFCVPLPLCLPRLLSIRTFDQHLFQVQLYWLAYGLEISSVRNTQLGSHTLRRQQLSTRLFLALTMALRCSVQI